MSTNGASNETKNVRIMLLKTKQVAYMQNMRLFRGIITHRIVIRFYFMDVRLNYSQSENKNITYPQYT